MKITIKIMGIHFSFLEHLAMPFWKSRFTKRNKRSASYFTLEDYGGNRTSQNDEISGKGLFTLGFFWPITTFNIGTAEKSC